MTRTGAKPWSAPNAGLRAASWLLVLGSGCGGGQTSGAAFDRSWTNDDGAGIAAFQQRFASLAIPSSVDVAVGVVRADTLIGMPLPSGSTWTFRHRLDARPAAVGSVVVGMGAGELFALDARTGKPLWKRLAGGRFRGAGDDGQTTVIALTSTTGQSSVVLAIDHDGNMVRQLEDDAAIGTPTVVGTYAFLPWQGQFVTVYDLVEGTEAARILLRTQTSQALTVGGAVFFGEGALTRLDENTRFASAGRASTIKLPEKDLPGSPRWIRPGTDVVPVGSSSLDKVRLYARPRATGPATVEDARFAATYFRIAVGFEVPSGGVAWAHGAAADILGGDTYPGGYALCDASGKITFIDAKSGGVSGEASFGVGVESCVVHSDGVKRTAAPPPGRVAEQLARVVTLPQAEHVTFQRVLLREMAALDDEGVTKTIIDLASAPSTSPVLLDDARRALAKRRNGSRFMLEALGRHYDFLADVLRAPPVGPLADALAALGEKRAAPLLAAHLNDPANTPDDVERAARALVILADHQELAALTTFFAHYRGAADTDALANAVVFAAQALLRIGAVELVAHASTDAQTLDSIKPRISELLKTKGSPKDSGG